MKHELKRAARLALKATAAIADPMFGSFSGPRILIYHQVGTDLGREMEVSTEAFTRQLDWIRANGKIVDLETAINHDGEPDVDEMFVLTFDDGFEDVYDNAYPLMKAREIPFTLYLTSRPIETGEPLDNRYPDARPLTWEQVKEMSETGLVTIGAHTHTHLDLHEATADQVREELDTSNRLIVERTGVSPKHFTYPWGRWSATADAFVRERYESSTIVGLSGSVPRHSSHRISRLPVQRSDSLTFFVRRMTYGLRLEERVRTVLSRFR